MNIHHKQSPSSPQTTTNAQQGESRTKKPLPWLGPSDDIPDVGFAAFLQIMHKHCSELVYSREAVHYARFHRANANALDPDFQSYPIIAREQGTIVGHEQIEGLFDEFEIPIQRFRDACNLFYELNASPANNVSSKSPTGLAGRRDSAALRRRQACGAASSIP